MVKEIHKHAKKNKGVWFLLIDFLLIAAMFFFSSIFYNSMEQEIYDEHTTYMNEIASHAALVGNTISSAQWDCAKTFANRLQKEGVSNREELTYIIEREEALFEQQGLSLLVFDANGLYYDSMGEKARWSGNKIKFTDDSPQRQIEIIKLLTGRAKTDEMVFVYKMDEPMFLDDGTKLTHLAIVRDMDILGKMLSITSFDGQGECYIVDSDGTRVYRDEKYGLVIGNVYNVLKPLESVSFQHDGSYEKLKQAVANGSACSFEFAFNNSKYYVTTVAMENNGWVLLSIVPSYVISEKMQNFMRTTLFGIGGISLIVILAIAITIFLIVRYHEGQHLIAKQSEVNSMLQRAAEAAKQASQAKTVFLSQMSHDIRTPINGVLGMADIGLRNIDDKQRLVDCLNKIISSSRHLLSLVNDVLDMSRIESGKVQLENKPFSLPALLDGCYSVVSGDAEKKKIDFRQNFSEIMQPVVLGDELHMWQIIINILGNAVKFTPEGGRIDFIAKSAMASLGQAELMIVIEDNGIGMTEEFQQKIFDPFSRESSTEKTHYSGTGLGMSIVKKLVDLMDGSISIKSAPGEGSRFTVRVRLPIAEIDEEKCKNVNLEKNIEGMRVLLVEDNDLNMEITRYILEDCGVKVTPALNGKEALDVFTEHDEGTFDLILMDIMMPVMNGLDACRAIRACGKRDCNSIAIVAMTANAYEEDKQMVFDAGMNEHLAKPAEREKLIEILHKYRRTEQNNFMSE